jgi:hypothetical protein
MGRIIAGAAYEHHAGGDRFLFSMDLIDQVTLL